MRSVRPVWDRLWEKVDTTGLCWEWLGSTAGGYGSMYPGAGGGTTRPHRIAYELLVGPIPAGLTVDHLCRNKLCVNPDHFDLVDAGTNTLRGGAMSARNARKTHCPSGHPYDEANTLRQGGGRIRRCRACEIARSRANREREES